MCQQFIVLFFHLLFYGNKNHHNLMVSFFCFSLLLQHNITVTSVYQTHRFHIQDSNVRILSEELNKTKKTGTEQGFKIKLYK